MGYAQSGYWLREAEVAVVEAGACCPEEGQWEEEGVMCQAGGRKAWVMEEPFHIHHHCRLV